MQLYLPNIPTDNIIVFDIEYDQNSLVQLAFLLLQRYNKSVFNLSQSINIYIKQNKPLNTFFTQYTNITDNFLSMAGISLSQAQDLVRDSLANVDYNNCIITSHGLKGDLLILSQNGINWQNISNKYCTYNKAKQLLQRENNLTLTDIAAESGYDLFNAHNAYADVWGTLHAFCYLRELENER